MPGGGHSPEYDFNEDRPAGENYGYEIDNWVISNQRHWDNAYSVEHYSPSNDPDASEDDFGRHDFITLKEQAAKPSLASSTDRHAVYTKSGGLYVEDDSGNEVLLVEFTTPSVNAFPATTVCLFGQASAPTGWTKLLTADGYQDGSVLTINTAADGNALDSDGSGKVESLSATASHTLTAAQSGLPNHRHGYTGYYGYGYSTSWGYAGGSRTDQGSTTRYTNYEGGDNASSGHTHDITTPYYQEVILASKD